MNRPGDIFVWDCTIGAVCSNCAWVILRDPSETLLRSFFRWIDQFSFETSLYIPDNCGLNHETVNWSFFETSERDWMIGSSYDCFSPGPGTSQHKCWNNWGVLLLDWFWLSAANWKVSNDWTGVTIISCTGYWFPDFMLVSLLHITSKLASLHIRAFMDFFIQNMKLDILPWFTSTLFLAEFFIIV